MVGSPFILTSSAKPARRSRLGQGSAVPGGSFLRRFKGLEFPSVEHPRELQQAGCGRARPEDDNLHRAGRPRAARWTGLRGLALLVAEYLTWRDLPRSAKRLGVVWRSRATTR